MPNRRAQRIERKRARRHQVKSGFRAAKAKARRIADEVAELGPEVADALSFFRKHDVDPETVRAELMIERGLWAFSREDDVLTLSRETRDMLLGLMQ